MNYIYISFLRRNPKLERMNGWNLITSSLPTLTLIILEILFLFWEALPRLFVSYVNQSQISFLCGYFSVLLRSAAIWSPKAFPVLILIRSMLILVCRQSDPRNEQGWHLQTEWWYFSHCCSCCMIPLLFFFNIQDHSSSFDDSPMSGGEAMGYIIRTSEGIQPAFVWWCRYFYLSYWWYSYLWRHVLDLCHLQALCLPHVHRRQLHNGYNWGCLCFEPCISSSVALMWLVAAFCEACYSYALQDLWIADWHSRSRRAALGKGWCEDCSHRAWKCVWSSLSVWI